MFETAFLSDVDDRYCTRRDVGQFLEQLRGERAKMIETVRWRAQQYNRD